MPRCKDCTLYDLDSVKSKSGAVLSNRAARCLWKSTEVFPVSVMMRERRPSPGHMRPNEDHRCPRFIKRKEQQP